MFCCRLFASSLNFDPVSRHTSCSIHFSVQYTRINIWRPEERVLETKMQHINFTNCIFSGPTPGAQVNGGSDRHVWSCRSLPVSKAALDYPQSPCLISCGLKTTQKIITSSFPPTAASSCCRPDFALHVPPLFIIVSQIAPSYAHYSLIIRQGAALRALPDLPNYRDHMVLTSLRYYHHQPQHQSPLN